MRLAQSQAHQPFPFIRKYFLWEIGRNLCYGGCGLFSFCGRSRPWWFCDSKHLLYGCKVYKSDTGKVDVNAHPLMSVQHFTVVNLDPLDDLIDHLRRKCFHTRVLPESCQQKSNIHALPFEFDQLFFLRADGLQYCNLWEIRKILMFSHEIIRMCCVWLW